jgi:hypothetical protein
MKNWVCMLLILLSIASCDNKKKDKNASKVLPAELNEKYKEVKLPFHVADSTITEADGKATMSLASFTQYFPDSIFNSSFGTDRNITLHPIGKIEAKTRETYFITFAKGKNKSTIYLSVYDSSKHTVTLPLVSSDNDEVVNTASIDKKLTVVINREWTVKNDIFYNRSIYAYNNIGVFTTVLTETNEQRRAEATIINPLDTFPKLHKYSGDYAKGSKGQLFIRDGSTPTEYLFFVHFQSDNEEESCSGELRGKFNMTSDKLGQYSNSGDPCGMDFTFKSNEVQVKENGSCGNYRDIKCFFNDTYIKKKDAKPAAKKK